MSSEHSPFQPPEEPEPVKPNKTKKAAGQKKERTGLSRFAFKAKAADTDSADDDSESEAEPPPAKRRAGKHTAAGGKTRPPRRPSKKMISYKRNDTYLQGRIQNVL